MKQIIHNIRTYQYIILASICILSMIIWFFGPLLLVANQYPLQQIEKRLYIIALMYLAWALQIIFTMPKVGTINTNTAPKSPEAAKKIQALEGRFQGAIRFLKKTLINKNNKNISLSHLPWYLLIGPTGAGKTSLLANAGLNFILSKKFTQEKISASDSCDWWVTRDLVLIDTPGTYITSKDKTRSSVDNVLWDNLLKLILKFRRKNPISAIVIALPLPELIKQKNLSLKKQIIADLKQQIFQLQRKFGPNLPFYLVVTKCDLISGFLEFFSENSSDELSQAWGITFPTLKENERLVDIFTHRFNALIKRLNTQLITRLHQERNPITRPQIKDFPLQIERLKETLANFIKALMIPDLQLNGIYLTSAMQNISEEPNHQPQVINPHATQALQLLRAPIMPSKSYFIRQLVSHGLLSSADLPTQQNPSHFLWTRRTVYAGFISAVIIASMLLGKDFQHGIQQTYSIQNQLAQYQLSIQQPNQPGDRLIKAIPLLNSLQAAANNSNYNLSRLTNFLSFYSDKSQQTASTVYTQALQTIVLPEIKNYFEKYLQSSNEKNPVQLYAVLKAYLMLGDPQHFQVEYVTKTIKTLMPSSLSKQANDDLSNHINAIFNHTNQITTLNEEIIAKTRKQLKNLSSQELGLVILKNMNDNNSDSAIHLGTNIGDQPVFISKEIADQIPNMFTANAFQAVLTQEINTSATEALQGNWIIGNSEILSNEATINSLAEQMRSHYISNYIDIWESLLANLKLITPKNLPQTEAMIANLMSNTSPLLQLLQSIKQNTAFEAITSASPKLQALNILLANINDHQDNTLYQIFVNLRQLHIYLDAIVKSTDVEKASFNAAKLRIQDPTSDPITKLHSLAEQNPEPMKSWLNNLASQSWYFILQETSHHIESAWQVNIMPIYNSQIANRFPFNPNSTREVNLQQFTSLLGQQGALMNFYQSFLRPFVNETNKQWLWRVVDNQKIPVSDSILDQIQHCMKLQRAFFPNGDNKLFVPFTLQQVSLDKTLTGAHFSINGQQIVDNKIAERVPHTLSWPGTGNFHSTTVSLTAVKSMPAVNALKGDWGWFRLVNQSMQSVISPKQLLLTININGHRAKYMLFTQSNLNPFVSVNLQKFRLPEQLIEKS